MARMTKASQKPENTDNLPAVKDNKDTKERKPLAIETILAYRKRGLGVNEIAKLTDRTPSAISLRLKDVENLENFRTYKDSTLEELQRKLVQELSPEKIKGMSGGSLVTAAAILEDKVRLIRQQPTQIVEFVELQANLNTLLDQLVKLRQPAQLPADVIDIE